MNRCGIHLCVLVYMICLGGCTNLQNILKVERPTASLQGVRFDKVSLDSAGLLFDVEIKNPYPIDLPLLNMAYAVDSGGSNLFNGKANIQTLIPAKNKAAITLPAKIAYFDAFNALKSFKPGASIPYHATVGLSFDAPALGIINVPISHEGELAIPAIPKPSDMNLLIKLPKAP